MPDPFNPAPCCILGVCCPPENPDSEGKRRAFLEEEILASFGEVTADSSPWRHAARIAAKGLLARYDLVPKGLGAAIVTAYEPFFRQKLSR